MTWWHFINLGLNYFPSLLFSFFSSFILWWIILRLSGLLWNSRNAWSMKDKYIFWAFFFVAYWHKDEWHFNNNHRSHGKEKKKRKRKKKQTDERLTNKKSHNHYRNGLIIRNERKYIQRTERKKKKNIEKPPRSDYKSRNKVVAVKQLKRKNVRCWKYYHHDYYCEEWEIVHIETKNKSHKEQMIFISSPSVCLHFEK